MKKKVLPLLASLVSGILLLSCGTGNAKVDVDAIRTEAVKTHMASLTQVLVLLPTATPTPTAEPSATPTLEATATLETPIVASPCYKLLWIEDRSIPDGSQMKANEVFTKTWYVQNNGSCAWAPGFTFRHVGGDRMEGQPFVLTEPVPVGAKREISIQLVVPGGQSGLIQSAWRMSDKNGAFFGDTLTVNIIVGEALTPTAAP